MPSYADYALADTMAAHAGGGDVAARRRCGGRPRARAEARARGARGAARCRAASAATIEPWDWRFYAEKVRQVALRARRGRRSSPTSRSSAWSQAAFDCAGRLFGLRFVAARRHRASTTPTCGLRGARRRRRADRPVPARQLRAADQAQRRLDELVPAAVAERRQTRRRRCCRSSSTTTTSPRARPAQPTLLSFDDARTLFHEFGHGLHGLLSNVTYERAVGHAACCATSSSCRRSCSSTGSRSPRC